MTEYDHSKDPVFAKLSRREREILEIIHRLGAPTLSQIIDRMHSPPVRAAVRTLLNVMERKGYVSHAKSGREYIFQATQSRICEARSLLRGLLANFFDGSLKSALMSHFNDPARRLNSAEIDELAEMVEELKNSNTKLNRPSS